MKTARLTYMDKYNYSKIEKKWQKFWAKHPELFAADDKSGKPKQYILDMFPYPSGDGLHAGHVESYTATDIISRYWRMNGKNVLHPQGWDAFGLPAENYAIKTKIHPAETTKKAIATFKAQMKMMGFSYDWSRELNSADPDYYKWTQWFFLLLYKNGLAYKAKGKVNWCDSCQTVLANEQAEGGVCERCGQSVVQKDLEQWFFKITDFIEPSYASASAKASADKKASEGQELKTSGLLDGLDKIDWPDSTKAAQKNWIGKSEGAQFKMQISGAGGLVAKYDQILLATNNLSKKARAEELLKANGINIKILTPKDLGLEEKEAKEEGNLFENAKEKAELYRDKTDLPILGIDTGFFIEGEEIDSVKVKRNALKSKNEKDLSQEEIGKLMHEYYKDIARKRGGKVEAYWQDVFALSLPGKEAEIIENKREVMLTDQVKGKVDIYFPLRSLYISKATGKYIFEQNHEEEMMELAPYAQSLKKLLIQERTNFLEVFTTRLDTVFGMTFALIAPEHELVQKLKPQITNWNEVEKYIAEAKKKSELQRVVEVREKTGVELEGVKVINPFTKQAIPLFVSDFILAHYGTGAVMAVPAHDERDWEFAKKYKLPIEFVIASPAQAGRSNPVDGGAKDEIAASPRQGGTPRNDEKAYTEDGVLINSGEYNGLKSAEARKKMMAWLEREGIGERTINYKLRDWLVSRQRYWGAPIPIIYCDDCKIKRPRFLFLHAYKAHSKMDFWPWLKDKVEKSGFEVFAPDLPGGEEPKLEKQAKFILDNYSFNEQTIIVTHSLGGVLAMKLLESGKIKAGKLIMVAPPLNTDFKDNKKRPTLDVYCDWKFDFKKIKKNIQNVIVLADLNDYIVPAEHTNKISQELGANLIETVAPSPHFDCVKSDVILNNVLTSDILNQGMVPVPEKDLPVKLPTDVDFMPTGESPLVRSKKFHNVKCPVCGAKARRESDTMDTFVCSSWYYLRYADPKNKKEFASRAQLQKWLPVDLYVGGAEHVVLHLLYSRFFTKVLHNLGYIDFDEPFAKMRHQGIILAEDGRKMSKSLGNVVNPDDVVAQYGADALRMFEMFMGPLEDMKPWNTKGIIGISRFLERVWKLNKGVIAIRQQAEKQSRYNTTFQGIATSSRQGGTPRDDKIETLLHKTIKKVSEDIENLKFNTAISALMILVNESGGGENVNQEQYQTFLKLLAPFAPHLAEELWNRLGYKKSILTEKWPEYDPALIKEETIELVVQINGKVRSRLTVPADISEEEAKKMATGDVAIKKWLGVQEPKKVIFVKGRLINIVV